MDNGRTRWIGLLSSVLLLAVTLYVLMGSAGNATARGISTQENTITSAQIIARAQTWLNPSVPYSSQGRHDGYRTDCSGYVSMAWGLSKPGMDTVELKTVSEPIAQGDLQPGDILDNGLSGTSGHVAIFAGWVPGTNETRYNAYEESSADSKSDSSVSKDYNGGAAFVHGIQYPYWHDADNWQSYKPYRFKGIGGGGGNGVGTGDVGGRVVAGDTQQGIAGVRVVFTSGKTTVTTVTDSNGQYVLHGLPVGTASIATSVNGYLVGTITVVVQGSTTVQAATISLYPICTSASVAGGMAQVETQRASYLLTAWRTNSQDETSNCGASGSTPTPTATPAQSSSQGCSAPSLSGPASGASFQQSTSITISWSTNCTQSYAELSGGPYGTLNFGGWQGATSVSIGQMWPGSYSWHVKGRDGSGRETSWSSTWTFTVNNSPTATPAPSTPTPAPTRTPTSAPSVPAPNLYSPGNTWSYAQTTDISLVWNTSYPQGYCELWGAPYSTLNFGGWQSGNSIHIGQMWPGTFSWHCKVRDSGGHESAWSATWTFTINNAPAPTPTQVPASAVTLLSPGNGSSFVQSTSITLSWTTGYPQSYCELWGAPYSTLNFGGWTSAHSIIIGQMWPGTFSWHCKARDSGGHETGWSPTWTFTIHN